MADCKHEDSLLGVLNGKDNSPIADTISPVAIKLARKLFDIGMPPGVLLKLQEAPSQLLGERGIGCRKKFLNFRGEDDFKHRLALDARRFRGLQRLLFRSP